MYPFNAHAEKHVYEKIKQLRKDHDARGRAHVNVPYGSVAEMNNIIYYQRCKTILHYYIICSVSDIYPCMENLKRHMNIINVAKPKIISKMMRHVLFLTLYHKILLDVIQEILTISKRFLNTKL